MKNLVQIGCNEGKDDVSTFLEKTSDKYNTILVDANKDSLLKCEQSYSELKNIHDIKFLCYAIVPINDDNNKYIDIYIPKNDQTSPFVSVFPSHTLAHARSDLDTVRVETISLDVLFQRYNLYDIEYLYIDTEGLCVDILFHLDLKKYNIENIIFEYIHSDGMLSYGGPNLQKLYQKLEDAKYDYHQEGYNTFCKKIK